MTLSPEVRPALALTLMVRETICTHSSARKINDFEGSACTAGSRVKQRDWSHQRRSLHGAMSFGLEVPLQPTPAPRELPLPRARLFLTRVSSLWLQVARVTHRLSRDGEKDIDLQALIMAFRIGPTYGGGFKVCPRPALMAFLPSATNTKVPSFLTLLALVYLARAGKHASTPRIIESVKQAVVISSQARPHSVDGAPLQSSCH